MGCGASRAVGAEPQPGRATENRVRGTTWSIEPELMKLLEDEHILEDGWDADLCKTDTPKHLQEELNEIAAQACTSGEGDEQAETANPANEHYHHRGKKEHARRNVIHIA